MSLSTSLNITQNPVLEEDIVKNEYYDYIPFSSNYSNNDEIRISIQNGDVNVLLSDSSLLIKATVTKPDGTEFEDTEDDLPILVNGGILHAFSSIRYEFNGKEICSTRNLPQTVLLKAFASYNENEIKGLNSAGISLSEHEFATNLNFMLPLKLLMGLMEDFNKILIQGHHQLILQRANTDINCFKCKLDATNFKLNISKITWKVPHITLSDKAKLKSMKIFEKNSPLPIAYRTWESFIYPTLPTSNHEFWRIKTTIAVEKPVYLIFGFQTARDGNRKASSSVFDNCDLSNITVHLNQHLTPYEPLSIDYDKDSYHTLYAMYAKFRSNYYGLPELLPQPCLSMKTFKNNQIIVIDTKYQYDTVNDSSVDVTIEIKTKADIPANTSLFCCFISDRIYTYKPISREVMKMT